MATRISQKQLDKFISPDAAMAPYERAQQDKTQRNAQDAALRQLITGKEMDLSNHKESATWDSEVKQSEREASMGAIERARAGLPPGSKVTYGDVGIDTKAPAAFSMGLTPGQKAADINFGKEYSDYVAGGGSEASKKNLGLLEDVKKQLSDPNAKEPNVIERGIQSLPDGLRTFLTPKIKAQEDQVRTAIQGSLRQTLGGQYTEKEGEGLMRRSYDPRLSAAQNLAKMQPEIDALKAQIQQKQRSAEQFERTGTLVGLGATGGYAQTPQQPSYAPDETDEDSGTVDDAGAESAYQSAVRAQGRSTAMQPETKVINGVQYMRVQGGWKRAQ